MHDPDPDDTGDPSEAELEALYREAFPEVAPPPDYSSHVPDLVDVHLPGAESYLWMRMTFHTGDLQPSPCGHGQVGAEPDWLSDQLTWDGGRTIISPPLHYTDSARGSFCTTWLDWSLEHALAPGQVFLLRVEPPEDDGEEDLWVSSIVRRAPLTVGQATRRWNRMLAWIERRRSRLHVELTMRREQARTDLRGMGLVMFSYGSDFARKSSVCICLRSVHMETLAEGRSATGDQAEALRNLLFSCALRLPHLDPAFIRTLPVRWS